MERVAHMEVVRKIVNSNQLDKIELPKNFINKRVEIIIFPVDEKNKMATPKKTVHDFVGIFEEYKNPDLVSSEKEAWGKAVMDKHGTD